MQPTTCFVQTMFVICQNLMEEALRVHSEQLTSMRLPLRKVILKPVAKANNPIIRKRLRYSRSL